MTHEELEEAKNNPISVALTVGKKVPIEWFEKANGKKILGLACGGGQQGPTFAAKRHGVTVADFSASQSQRNGTATEREGLKINTVQADMTKPSPFVDETLNIILNPVSNVYMEDLENMYQGASRILRKGGLLMAGSMDPRIYMYDANIVRNESDEELLLEFSIPFNSEKPGEEGKITIDPRCGYKFSHTLEAQIRGQLRNGLAMIDFYELCNKRHRLSRYGNGYIATLRIKL